MSQPVSTVSAVSKPEGNTKLRARGRAWCLTINNYDDQEYDLTVSDISKFTTYIVGKEIGEQGTKHLQCYFRNDIQVSFSTVKDTFPRAHIEKARGNVIDNITYCSKGGDYVTNYVMPYVEQPYVITELRDWQKEVLEIIENEEPNDRDIHWYVDEEGNKGKSALCKYLAFHNKALWIRGGKANDIMSMLLKEKNCRDIVIDIPRDSGKNISYKLIEMLKDGYIFSTKYEGGKKFITTPHVFIFANWIDDEPYDKMSKDRWNIHRIL